MKRNTILTGIVLLVACNEMAIGSPPAGRVIGWGNGGGEKLDVATGDSRRYINVDGQQLTNVVAVAALGLHAMAIKSDGTLVAWGWDENKKLITVPPGLSNVMSISLAEDHNVALRADGSVVSWGYDKASAWYDPEIVLPAGISNVVGIAGGGSDSLLLKRGGSIERWGGINGALPEGLSNIISIACCHGQLGDDLALRSDGTVVEWPSFYAADNDPLPMPPGLSNVIAIAAGAAHALALRRDGTVVSWGAPVGGYLNPNYGQTNVPAGLGNVVAIAAGPFISMALKKDGTVVVWGENDDHEVDLAAGLSNIVAIAAGQDFCLAIQTNGTLVETNIPPAPLKP